MFSFDGFLQNLLGSGPTFSACGESIQKDHAVYRTHIGYNEREVSNFPYNQAQLQPGGINWKLGCLAEIVTEFIGSEDGSFPRPWVGQTWKNNVDKG